MVSVNHIDAISTSGTTGLMNRNIQMSKCLLESPGKGRGSAGASGAPLPAGFSACRSAVFAVAGEGAAVVVTITEFPKRRYANGVGTIFNCSVGKKYDASREYQPKLFVVNGL